MWKNFRPKQPTVVGAWQFDGVHYPAVHPFVWRGSKLAIDIGGVHVPVKAGDWVVKEGARYYVLSAAAFGETYGEA